MARNPIFDAGPELAPLPDPTQQPSSDEIAAMIEQAHQQAQLAAQQAQLEQNAYQTALAQPTPQVNPIAAGFGMGLSRLGQVIAGPHAPNYAGEERALIESNKKQLESDRQANLLRLRQTYEAAAKRAADAGDHEAEIKARASIHKLDVQAKKDAEAARQDFEKKQNADKFQQQKDLAEINHQNKLKEQADEEGAGPVLSPAAKRLAVRFLLQTGQLPSNLGRGKQATKLAVDIFEEAAKVDPNASLAGAKAYFGGNQAAFRQLQARQSNIRAFEKTANKNIDMLNKTIDKLPDVGLAIVNGAVRSGLKAVGSEDVANFNAALKVVQPEIARILSSPTASSQLTNYSQKEVEQMIAGNYTRKQLRSVIAILQQDMRNRDEANQTVLDELQQEIRASGGYGEEPAPSTTPKPTHRYNPTTGKIEPIQ